MPAARRSRAQGPRPRHCCASVGTPGPRKSKCTCKAKLERAQRRWQGPGHDSLHLALPTKRPLRGDHPRRWLCPRTCGRLQGMLLHGPCTGSVLQGGFCYQRRSGAGEPHLDVRRTMTQIARAHARPSIHMLADWMMLCSHRKVLLPVYHVWKGPGSLNERAYRRLGLIAFAVRRPRPGRSRAAQAPLRRCCGAV